MVIKHIVLQNFQGISHTELDFSPGVNKIIGDNGTGKTTIANAICWILFDTSFNGIKKYLPKPVYSKDGDRSPTVIVVLECDNQEYILKKTLREIWHNQKLGGHTTEYFINDIPKTQTEFENFLQTLYPVAIGQSLIDPLYFNRYLHWEERRNILISLCDDITLEKIIGDNSKLLTLKQDLINHDVKDLLKMLNTQKKELNRSIQALPYRIDEILKMIKTGEKDTGKINEIKDEIERLKKEKEKIESKEFENILQRHYEASLKDYNDSYAHYNSNMDKRRNKINEIIININKKQQEIEKLKQKTQDVILIRNDLLKQYQEIQKQQWNENMLCLNCGQKYPQEKFLQQKKQALEEINQKGKNEASKEKIKELQEQIKKIEKEIEDLKRQKQNIEKTIVPFEKTETGILLAKRIAFNKQRMTTETDWYQNQSKLEAINKRLEELKNNLVALERIKELQGQQQKLANDFIKIEQKILACEEFIRTKIKIITNSINDKFKNVKFNLFHTQINGEIKDCCDTLINIDDTLVPFNMANHGSCIKAGLEIIDILSRHFKIKLPIIVDNAESITSIPKIPGHQMITLYVSDKHKELTLLKGVNNEKHKHC